MSKTVFDHLTEQLDGVVKGRRYIIAEIGKLKVSVEDLKDEVIQTVGSETNIGAVINDLKTFMQRTIGTLGDLKNTVGKLGIMVKSLESQVQSLKKSGVQAGARAPVPTARSPLASGAPAATPMAATPMATTPVVSAPAPSGGGGGTAVAAAFGKIFQAASSGVPAKDIGGMLDALRTSLSRANPLNPILFELSMEAGRLKSLGGSKLDAGNLGTFQQKINSWKAKS